MLCLPLVRRPAGIAAIIRPFGPRVYIAGPKTAARTFGLPDQPLPGPAASQTSRFPDQSLTRP